MIFVVVAIIDLKDSNFFDSQPFSAAQKSRCSQVQLSKFSFTYLNNRNGTCSYGSFKCKLILLVSLLGDFHKFLPTKGVIILRALRIVSRKVCVKSQLDKIKFLIVKLNCHTNFLCFHSHRSQLYVTLKE